MQMIKIKSLYPPTIVSFPTGGRYVISGSNWIPVNDDDVSKATGKEGIFGFGYTDDYVGMTNLVSETGVVAADVAAVGTARYYIAACGYGGDKGIFGFGSTASGNY